MSTATVPVVPAVPILTTGSAGEGAARPAEATWGARNVLMICQAFPPTGGPGVQRGAKFAKYLPRLGWRTVVWSADHLEQLPRDAGLMAGLPADLVRYTRPAWSYAAGHRRVMRTLRELGVAKLLSTKLWDGLEWRTLQFLRALSAHMIPDDQITWVLRSAVPLLTVVRRERIDVVFSTYSPVANHLLGLLVKCVTGLPWVADFRDLWTDDYCYTDRSRARRWLERNIEQAILQRADAVVAVTQSQARVLGRHVPRHSKKVVCISNGVDYEDFAHLDRDRVWQARHGATDRFVLTFAGWFLSDRVDEGLIEGLGRFARRAHERDGRFEFRVVGTMSEEMSRRFSKAGVTPSATGYLPHDEAIEHMIGADVLLLPAPTGPNADSLMPGKVFEYLAAGRPILLVGPTDGEVQRLVRRCRAGVCVESNPDAVAEALTELWRKWRGGRLPGGCAPDLLRPFTREHLAGRLAEVLNHVRRKGPPGKPRRR